MQTRIERRGWGRGRRLVVALLLAVVGLAAPAAAEVRRVEAVGIYGIRDALRRKVIPRDEAISDARWEGVSRVALELIGDSPVLSDAEELLELSGDDVRGDGTIAPLESLRDGGARIDPDDVRLDRMAPSEDEVALLSSALGEDMLPYTRSYRILEDQGERPVLFADAPGIDTEYVVVVEVIVDVDRVTAALEDAGLVVATEKSRKAEALTVELVGLARYEALEKVLAALRGPLGATRVATLEFERERQLLAVEGPFDADQLASRLSRFEDPRLVLEPVALDPVFGRLRVLARWFPAVSDAENGAAAGTAGPGR